MEKIYIRKYLAAMAVSPNINLQVLNSFSVINGWFLPGYKTMIIMGKLPCAAITIGQAFSALLQKACRKKQEN